MTLGRALGVPAGPARAIKSATGDLHAAAEVAAPLQNDRDTPSASDPADARGKFRIRGVPSSIGMTAPCPDRYAYVGPFARPVDRHAPRRLATN